jgi:hypothetical protein
MSYTDILQTNAEVRLEGDGGVSGSLNTVVGISSTVCGTNDMHKYNGFFIHVSALPSTGNAIEIRLLEQTAGGSTVGTIFCCRVDEAPETIAAITSTTPHIISDSGNRLALHVIVSGSTSGIGTINYWWNRERRDN